MPIYEYQCEEHGQFSHQASIADRNKEFHCPICGSIAKRIISAPSLSIMSDTNRQAWARNEKSAHEPMHKNKHVCTSSCNHNHSSSSNSQSNFMQSQVNKRPWMLGH